MRTFRAWIDERGSNKDREHARFYCRHIRYKAECRHIRMVDLETNSYRILLRFAWRRRPRHLRVVAFFRAHRGTTLVKIGRTAGAVLW